MRPNDLLSNNRETLSIKQQQKSLPVVFQAKQKVFSGKNNQQQENQSQISNDISKKIKNSVEQPKQENDEITIDNVLEEDIDLETLLKDDKLLQKIIHNYESMN
jgi:hypothetical protein